MAFLQNYALGGYDLADEQVRAFSLPLSYTLEPRGRRPALRLKLPIMLGVQDFSSFDKDFFDLERIRMWAVVPGVELLLPLTPRWTLTPGVDFGVGSDSSGGELVWIFGVGIGAIYARPFTSFDFFFEPRVRYSGTHSASGRNRDGFVDLMLRFELRRVLACKLGGKRLTPGVYVEGHAFPYPLRFERGNGDERDTRAHGEVGLTFGTRPAHRIWFFDLPRIGVGFRFGENFRGLRIRIGDWAPPPRETAPKAAPEAASMAAR
jgi:hypothetical protein